jgi:hypothetical protein
MSSRALAIGAGVILFLIAAAPTAALVYAIRTGAVGTASTPGIMIPAYLIIAAVVAGLAHRLDRGLQVVAGDDRRSAADIWVPFFVAACVIVVGAFVAPVAILAVLVNSDRSLADSPLYFYLWWGGAFLLIGLLSLGLGLLSWKTLGRRYGATTPSAS